jgi:iron complex outermembrane recepter protein
MRIACFGLLAACWACAGLAQHDSIVITATRFPQGVRSLPASITVISAPDIARSTARTLPELISQQVGATMKDFFGNNAAVTSVDLRGYGATAAQNTLVLVDGRRLGDIDLSGVQWAALPLSSVERIEILRGTGAVLYGDAATAGVVNIVTRSPLMQASRLELFGRIASYGTFEGQVHGSQAGERLGVSATVHGYASEGYRANNRHEQQNNSLNLRWALGEAMLDVRAGTDRQDLRLPGGRFVQPSIGLDEYATDPRGAATTQDYSSRDGTRMGTTLTWHSAGNEFSLGLDYRDKDARAYFDQGGFPTYRADDLDLRSLTPRARLPFNTGGLQHRLTVGADWHAWRYRSRRTDRPENLPQPTNRVAIDVDTAGWYLHDTIELGGATVATAGWRSERAKFAGEDTLDPSSPGCSFCTGAAPVRESQRVEAWELGLRRALGPRWSAYARTGTSFRFVNAEEIYENDAAFAAQFQVLRPQRARTHESGLEWQRGTSALRAALFRSRVEDEIHLDPFTAGVGNTNLPPSRRQGVELDARWQPLGRLQATAAYAYTDARFLEGTLPGSAFAIGTDMPIGGRRVPLVPRHKLNLGLAWEPAAGLRVSAALSALSEQVLDNDEPNTLEHRIPAYYLVDASVARSYAWGRLVAVLNNALDERYYTYAVRSAFTPDRYSVYPLPGRTLSLTAELVLR